MDLINLNSDQVSQYQFFKLIFLLEQHFIENNKSLERQVRLLPAEPLSFPAADIKKIYSTLEDKVVLQLNFMGLYGVDSPLPHYYLMHSLIDNEIGEAIKQFLDIFNQQLYFLFYRAWQKYHPFAHLNQNKYLEYLIALSGNSLCLTDRQEFSYANMFGATMRNSANLKHMLQIYLKKIAISLHEFVPQWVEVDDVFYIGDNNLSLGQNTLLGERVLDVNGRIDIEIGPMLIEDATALLPKQEQGKRLIHLLQRYIGNLLEFRVVFLLVPGQQICKVLGHDLFVLAWGAWLGKPLTQPYMQPIYSSKLAQFQFDD